jgi:tripartite ATP-independent transporter DctP family solute receptor
MMRKLLLPALASIVGILSPDLVSAAEIVLKAAHGSTLKEPYHLGMVRAKEVLEEQTSQKATMNIFPANQLGSEKEMVQGALFGSIDVFVVSNGVVGNFVPELKVFEMPFLFRSQQHMDKVFRGPILKDLNKFAVAKGLRLLGFYSAGVRHIMTKKPINSIDDLKNLKIRTMQVPSHVAAFKAFGANATPISYGELYGSLQTGVVDGAEAANTNYDAMKFYQVAPHWAMVGWTSLVSVLAISEKKFQSLPVDVRDAIVLAGAESAAYERDVYAKSDAELVEPLKKLGVQITRPDPAPFREASKEVYNKMLTTDIDKRLLQVILETK